MSDTRYKDGREHPGVSPRQGQPQLRRAVSPSVSDDKQDTRDQREEMLAWKSLWPEQFILSLPAKT